MSDGDHGVHLVDCPTPFIEGVVVIDVSFVESAMSLKRHDLGRCIVFARQDKLDVNAVWVVGIRQVIHAGCLPHLGVLVVLAADMR